ncbi:MAG: hypothetical protein M1826_003824 [Phylliscum demangeonii]|nr:MAG: hypothetical protein M1826_003824 [Phylliscum demangeonii]
MPLVKDLFPVIRQPDTESLTQDHIRLDSSSLGRPLTISMDELLAHPLSTAGVESRREVLEYVWQSLASMIVAAADDGGSRSDQIMPHVLQIMAHLYHSNALSPHFYSPVPAPDRDGHVQRSPTLHLLSSRILASMSDASGKAGQELVAAHAAPPGPPDTLLGVQIPAPSFEMKMRELGPEVWMELVLWAALDEGLASAAANILLQMKARLSLKSRWRTVPWRAVERARSGVGGATGVKEGNGFKRPLVGLGVRTISSEVVAATIDGVLDCQELHTSSTSTSARPVHAELPDTELPDYTIVAKLLNMIRRDGHQHEPELRNQAFMRIAESLGPALHSQPEKIDSIVKATMQADSDPPRTGVADEDSTPTGVAHGDSAPTGVADEHPVNVGRYTPASAELDLDSLLLAASQAGDFRNAYSIYERLKVLVGASAAAHGSTVKGSPAAPLQLDRQHAREFAAGLASEDSVEPRQVHVVRTLPPNRVPALVAFLETTRQLGDLHTGTELLYAPVHEVLRIPEHAYGEDHVAPALIRFAGDTSDGAIFDRVRNRIALPLTDELYPAYFYCLVHLQRWQAVRGLLLQQWHEGGGVTWDAELAFSIACMLLDHHGRRGSWRRQLHRPPAAAGAAEDDEGGEERMARTMLDDVPETEQLLAELLRGDYGAPKAAGARPHDGISQLYHGHLVRIIRASSDIFSSLKHDGTERAGAGRWDSPVALEMISVHAFNQLLDAVVRNRGCLAGKRLFDAFCRPFGPAPAAAAPTTMPTMLNRWQTAEAWTVADRSVVPLAAARVGPGPARGGHDEVPVAAGTSSWHRRNRPHVERPFEAAAGRADARAVVHPNLITLDVLMRGAWAELTPVPRLGFTPHVRPGPGPGLGPVARALDRLERRRLREDPRAHHLFPLLCWGRQMYSAMGVPDPELRRLLPVVLYYGVEGTMTPSYRSVTAAITDPDRAHRRPHPVGGARYINNPSIGSRSTTTDR